MDIWTRLSREIEQQEAAFANLGRHMAIFVNAAVEGGLEHSEAVALATVLLRQMLASKKKDNDVDAAG